MSQGNSKDPQNPYPMTRTNDPGTELVGIVIDWYRSHRAALNSTEATNVSTQITNILNGTVKV